MHVIIASLRRRFAHSGLGMSLLLMRSLQGAYAGLAILVLLSRLLIKYRASSSLVQATLWLTVPFALSSNLLFPVGTVVGERLLYLPSVGFCIILAHLVAEFVEAGGRGVDNGGPELMADGSEDRVKRPGTTSVQGAGVKSKGRAPGQARGPISGAYRDDVAAFPLDLSGILLWARGWRFIVSSLACGILCSAYAVVRCTSFCLPLMPACGFASSSSHWDGHMLMPPLLYYLPVSMLPVFRADLGCDSPKIRTGRDLKPWPSHVGDLLQRVAHFVHFKNFQSHKTLQFEATSLTQLQTPQTVQRSYIRNPVWSTTIGLFEAHTRIVPNSVRMHHGFAGELANSGEHKIAAMYYKKAIRWFLVPHVLLVVPLKPPWCPQSRAFYFRALYILMHSRGDIPTLRCVAIPAGCCVMKDLQPG